MKRIGVASLLIFVACQTTKPAPAPVMKPETSQHWIREQGGALPAANGRYTINVNNFHNAIQSLATELLTIEATGGFHRANTLLNRHGVSTPEMQTVIASLKDIPVDIWPVFPAAGET